ncbi:unnamed protein product, partial [Meganyctiphanes norvegica]
MSGVSAPVATGDPVTLSNLKQDSLMIPVARMSHFFPAGHPIPTSGNTGGRLRLLETPEPSIHIAIHLLGPPTPITPSIQWQLNDPHDHMKNCVTKAFKAVVASVGTQFLQGMVLLNLERGGELGPVEFPFLVLWVVDGAKCDYQTVIDKIRTISYEQLDPVKTGFTCEHYFDTYEEVATLAKPPIENLSRKPTSKTSGYIVRVFKVFEGDDGQKFERNWLMWTGARLLYKSISAEVGLRRLTLHKSNVQNGIHIYILLCDMANFLTHICQAVKAIP